MTLEQGIPFKILLVLLFIGGTIPIGSHILARAAYRAGIGMKAPLVQDDYQDKKQSKAAENSAPAS